MTTLSPRYFDQMYAAAPDPWGFTSRWYEKRKYALSLAMLPAERYGLAFELGCSIGVLTRQLAGRCDQLLACDIAGTAVSAATRRTAGCGNVRVEQRVLPGDWPDGEFDLIVASEVLYYFGGEDLLTAIGRCQNSLRPGGTLLAVHWRHPVAEYPRSGDSVHEALAARPGLAVVARHTEADFVAEVYQRGETAVSVAQATGLI
ncbi:MAG TPA: class I SAM-dependent methyltransferase [Streptosporangiaceae bacterium]